MNWSNANLLDNLAFCRVAAALQKLLLRGGGFCGFDFCGGVGVFFGEAFDAAGGVDQFLLTGEEGVAIGADFDVQHVALDGRTGSEIVAAGAVHRDGVIVGVDTWFHETPFCRVRSARPPQQGWGTTAASLGREAIHYHTRSVKFRQTGSVLRK
jgi:hypothetical protein